MKQLDRRLRKIKATRKGDIPSIYEWRAACRHGMTPEEWRDTKAFWIWWQEHYYDEDDIQDTPEQLWMMYQISRERHTEGPLPVVEDGVVSMAIFEQGRVVRYVDPGEGVAT